MMADGEKFEGWCVSICEEDYNIFFIFVYVYVFV